MAAPITHIALALQLLAGPLNHHNPKDFIIGACFPDISHLGCVKEEKTRIKKASWRAIQQETSSFKAGMMLNALTNTIHERFVEETNLLSHLPFMPYKSSILTFIEDTLLYKKVDSWPTVSGYFETILEEELAFGASKKDVVRWHTMLQHYCRAEPTVKVLAKMSDYVPSLSATLGFFSDTIDHMVRGVKNNRRLVALIDEFYTSFPQLLEESSLASKINH